MQKSSTSRSLVQMHAYTHIHEAPCLIHFKLLPFIKKITKAGGIYTHVCMSANACIQTHTRSTLFDSLQTIAFYKKTYKAGGIYTHAYISANARIHTHTRSTLFDPFQTIALKQKHTQSWWYIHTLYIIRIYIYIYMHICMRMSNVHH
jgi:hypothetical protein